MKQYLAASRYIDFEHEAVRSLAERLLLGAESELEVVRRSFEFVRDQIRHSADFKLNPVTCKASDVRAVRFEPME